MPILGIMASSTSGANLVGDYQSISTVTVGSGGAADITFSSIPATYTHLQIRGIARGSRATYGNDNLNIQFNSDTGSNYSWHKLQGDGSSASAGGNATQTQMTSNALAGSGAPSGDFSAHILDILDYANTSKYKTLRGIDGVDINGTVAANGGVIELHSGSWRNTAAITSVTLIPGTANFIQYTSFALYGIKG
jgi:hypothetical protein